MKRGRKIRPTTTFMLAVIIMTISLTVGACWIQKTHEPAEIQTTTPTTSTPAGDVEILTYELDPYVVSLIAKTIYGEANVVKSTAQQAAVAWCIFNRADSDDPYYPDTVEGVITQPHQFAGYNADNPVTEELYALAADVMLRWMAEKDGDQNVGRTLPADYIFFTGDGESNHFTNTYKGTDFWDWSLPDPYEN